LQVAHFFDWLARLIDSRHRLLWLALIAASAVAILGATEITFRDGAREIFASTSPEFTQYQKHIRDFPQADTDILIIARSEHEFNREQIEELRNFIVDVQLVDGIENAVSIFAQQEFHPESEEYRNLFATDLSTHGSISTLLQSVRDTETKIVPLINNELNQTVMIVSATDRMTDIAEADPMLGEIDGLMAELSQSADLEVGMTGLLPVRHRIVERLTREQIMLNVIGGILGSLVSLVLFRSVLVGALNGVAPTFAFLFTVGSYGLLGFELNVISTSVTVLILVLSMASCIHMTHEIRKHAAAGLDRSAAIRKMLIEIGPPSVLTSLTTILALASLYYSDSSLIRNFASAGITGMVLVLISVIVIHPLVYRLTWDFTPVRAALTKKELPQQSWAAAFARTSQWLLKRKYTVAATSVATALFLLSQFIPVQTTHRFSQYLYDDDEMLVLLADAERISGPTQSLDIVLRQKQPGTLLSEVNLAEVEALHKALEDEFPKQPVLSLVSFARIMERNEGTATAAQIEGRLEQLPARVRQDLIGHNAEGFKLNLLVSGAESSEIRRIVQDVESVIASATLEQLQAEPITGLTAIEAKLSDRMIRELTISFLIAAFACPLLIAVWFGEWRFGIAAILPNILPILLVGAFLMWSGWKLQFSSAVALSVAFGVAVDDTVHVLNRLHIKRQSPNGAFTVGQLPEVMQHVAPALLTTTLVLSFGLLGTAFSSMPTAAYFGMLCITIFILALLCDLFLLLPMIGILGFGSDKARKRRKSDHPVI